MSPELLPESLSGVFKSVRFIRSTVAMVALVFILIFVAFIVVLFAPLEPIAKYILVAVIIGLGIAVWCAFWTKAKKEPLTVSEQYWIAALPYMYGTNLEERTREEELNAEKTIGNAGVHPPSQLPQPSDTRGD